MSQPLCPKCSQPLKDDYGMATCSRCGSFVFVDMEGVAHFSDDEPARAMATKTAPQTSPPPAQLPDAEGFEPLSFDTRPGEAPPTGNTFGAPAAGRVEDESSGGSGHEEAPGGSPGFGFDAHGEPGEADHVAEGEEFPGSTGASEAEASAQVGSDQEFDMDKMLGFQDPDIQAPSADFGRPGDPLGTDDYANSEMSQAKDGPLIFKILISGIDSKELRESLRSALDDQRFGWNPGDLMSRISKGVLQIENVAPVKAVILINRIKRLPVKVRWEQYAITQMG